MLKKKKAKNGKCNVSLDGELDIYAAASFHEAFMPCLNDCKSIVIDLSEVSEMDTSCFQVLIQAKRECEETGKEMQMVSHSPAVLEILDLYDMENFFGDPLLLPSNDGDNATTENKA